MEYRKNGQAKIGKWRFKDENNSMSNAGDSSARASRTSRQGGEVGRYSGQMKILIRIMRSMMMIIINGVHDDRSR